MGWNPQSFDYSPNAYPSEFRWLIETGGFKLLLILYSAICSILYKILKNKPQNFTKGERGKGYCQFKEYMLVFKHNWDMKYISKINLICLLFFFKHKWDLQNKSIKNLICLRFGLSLVQGGGGGRIYKPC